MDVEFEECPTKRRGGNCMTRNPRKTWGTKFASIEPRLYPVIQVRDCMPGNM
jgi:hypothetical protein